jgi:hypothetical protein
VTDVAARQLASSTDQSSVVGLKAFSFNRQYVIAAYWNREPRRLWTLMRLAVSFGFSNSSSLMWSPLSPLVFMSRYYGVLQAYGALQKVGVRDTPACRLVTGPPSTRRLVNGF